MKEFYAVQGVPLAGLCAGVTTMSAAVLNEMGANVWTGQASITLPRGEVTNNANYLYFKLPWGPIRNTSIFYWTGIGGPSRPHVSPA